MDLCLVHRVESGSSIIGLSQEGQEKKEEKKFRGEKYIIEYITCRANALKLNPLTSSVV